MSSRRLHTQLAAESYMRDVNTRIERVLGLTGVAAGPLATLFCGLFIMYAKRIGKTREEATRKLHEHWEQIDLKGLPPVPTNLQGVKIQ